MNDGLGKKAEKKIKEWLDQPEEGYCFDRLKDQMTGFFGSDNICDFTLYKNPHLYYIESKASYQDRVPWDYLTNNQRTKMLEKSQIDGVYSIVIVLFATYKRAFMFQVSDIQKQIDSNKHSVNIKKIDKWTIPYVEIPTVPNTRKELLDYTGDFEELVQKLVCRP